MPSGMGIIGKHFEYAGLREMGIEVENLVLGLQGKKYNRAVQIC